MRTLENYNTKFTYDPPPFVPPGMVYLDIMGKDTSPSAMEADEDTAPPPPIIVPDDDEDSEGEARSRPQNNVVENLRKTVDAITDMVKLKQPFDPALNEKLIQDNCIKHNVPWQVYADIQELIDEWTSPRIIGGFETHVTAIMRITMQFAAQLAVPDFAAVHQELADQTLQWNIKMEKMADTVLKFQKEGSRKSEKFMGTLWSTYYEGWLVAISQFRKIYAILRLCNEHDQVLLRPHSSLSAIMGIFPSDCEILAPDPLDPTLFFHKVLQQFNRLGYVKQGDEVLQMLEGLPFGFPIGSLESVVSDVLVQNSELFEKFRAIRGVSKKDLVDFLAGCPFMLPVVRVREMFIVRGDAGTYYSFDEDTGRRKFETIPKEHKSGGMPIQVILMRRPSFDTIYHHGDKKRALQSVWGAPLIGPWSMIKHMCGSYLDKVDLGMENVRNQSKSPKCAVSYVGDLPTTFRAHNNVKFDKPGFNPTVIPMDLFKRGKDSWKRVPLCRWRYEPKETSEIEYLTKDNEWVLVSDWTRFKMEMSDPVLRNLFKADPTEEGQCINTGAHVPLGPTFIRIPEAINTSHTFESWDPVIEYISTIPELAPYIRVMRWQDFDWNKIFTFIVHCVGRSIHGPSVDRHHYGVFVGGESNSGKTRVAIDAIEIWCGNTAARPAASNKNNFSLEQWIKGKTTWLCNDMHGPSKDSALNADLFKNAVEGNKIEGPVKQQQKIDAHTSDINVIITANKYKITEVFPCPSESEKMALERRAQSYIFKTSFKENPSKGIEPIPAETFKNNFAYYITLGHIFFNLSLFFSKVDEMTSVISSNPYAVNNKTQWVPKDICSTIGLTIMAPALFQMIEPCDSEELEFGKIWTGGQNDTQPGLLAMMKKFDPKMKTISKEKCLQSLHSEISNDSKLFFREDDPVLNYDGNIELWPSPESYPLIQFIYCSSSARGRLTDRDIRENKESKKLPGYKKLSLDKFRLKGWRLKSAYGDASVQNVIQ